MAQSKKTRGKRRRRPMSSQDENPVIGREIAEGLGGPPTGPKVDAALERLTEEAPRIIEELRQKVEEESVKPIVTAARCPRCGQMYPAENVGRTAVCHLNCSQKVTFQGV